MNDRIRMLRDELGLTRSSFGQRIGVSADVVNNLERGRVEIKDHIIKLICSEYSVDENWLRNGTGSMYIQPPAFSLDEFVKQRGASDLELDIMKAYFDLDPDIRKMLLQHFSRRLSPDPFRGLPDTADEFEDIYPPIDPDSGSNSNAG